MSFDRAVAHVLRWEGNETNNPLDPGGYSRYGLSQRAYPALDLRTITQAQAAEIYRRDYWTAIRGDELPDRVAFALFDAAVNVGVTQAVKFLQRAVGVHVDGVLGPVTLDAVRNVDAHKLLRELAVERVLFYVGLQSFSIFGRGWLRRTLDTVMRA